MAAKKTAKSGNGNGATKTVPAKKEITTHPTHPVQSPSPKNNQVVIVPRFTKNHFLFALLGLFLIVLAAAPSYYFYTEYQKAQLALSNPTKAAEIEVEETIKRISKHILLPTNEVPSFATVSDVTKLGNQEFFRNAKNGDKVLIYTKAKKAYLYRPSEDILVDVSPLQLAEPAAPTPVVQTKTGVPGLSGSPKKIIPLRVSIYNGTQAVGLGGKIEQELLKKMDTVSIQDVINAQKRDYTRTIVIDVTGKNTEAANMVAKSLGAVVTNLPNTEVLPKNAEILVIIGADALQKKSSSPTPSVTVAPSPAVTITPAEASE